MKWGDLEKEEKDYYRELVSDYTKKVGRFGKQFTPKEPCEVTKEHIKKLYKKASAYFNTDEPNIIF